MVMNFNNIEAKPIFLLYNNHTTVDMYHELASNCSCQQSRYTVTCSIGVGSSPATHAGPASLAVSSSVCSHTDLLDC